MEENRLVTTAQHVAVQVDQQRRDDKELQDRPDKFCTGCKPNTRHKGITKFATDFLARILHMLIALKALLLYLLLRWRLFAGPCSVVWILLAVRRLSKWLPILDIAVPILLLLHGWRVAVLVIIRRGRGRRCTTAAIGVRGIRSWRSIIGAWQLIRKLQVGQSRLRLDILPWENADLAGTHIAAQPPVVIDFAQDTESVTSIKRQVAFIRSIVGILGCGITHCRTAVSVSVVATPAT